MKRAGVSVAVLACAVSVMAASDDRAAARRDPRPTTTVRNVHRVQSSEPQDRANLQGLDPAGVKERIGPPDEIDEHGESDELYWIYNTKEGTLSVHFQNGYVIGIDPRDFPVAKILK
jgi:hypothetical protein